MLYFDNFYSSTTKVAVFHQNSHPELLKSSGIRSTTVCSILINPLSFGHQ
ncbi:hypothetical protein ACTJIX_10830 [Acinetobacter sp. 22323]